MKLIYLLLASIIYNPQSQDNEKESAELAIKFITETQVKNFYADIII